MTMKRFICLLMVSTSFFACKKNKTGPNENAQRIRSISDGSQAEIFEYDAQGRVTRLYYNALASLKFTYSPAGVNIQRLGAGDVPDPDRATDFTIVNGRITYGVERMPNKLARKFYYGYDDAGRLTQVSIQQQYDGMTDETHYYQLTYDAKNNVTHIGFVRKDNGGQDNADSISITKTWYEKRFVSWGNMGFNYFGTAPCGQQHLGYGIAIPFSMAGYIYPGEHALKTETTDDYNWNALGRRWVFYRNSSFTVAEPDYEYDGNGRLVKYFGKVIEWQ